eukprot:GEMP01034799.1.p1 GENE.GEMP01034799.1~~GEMP01034799.1.p1  ORF type:complete len:226 (+),score=24.46 GEMP01034799.1:115-792(+)
MSDPWWRRICCANECQATCCARGTSTLLPQFWGSAKATVFPSELRELQAIFSVVDLLNDGSVDSVSFPKALRMHLATSQGYGLAKRLSKNDEFDNEFEIFLYAIEHREVKKLKWTDIKDYLSVRTNNPPTMNKQIDDVFANHEYTKRTDSFDLEDTEVFELRTLFNSLDTDQDGIVQTVSLAKAVRKYVKDPLFVGLPERMRNEESFVVDALERNIDLHGIWERR